MYKNEITNLLKNNYDKFTGSQKKICQYILDHYETVMFMSAVELSEIVGVSDVTIIRFVRNLGYSGYVEFKKCMREGSRHFESPVSRVSKTLNAIGARGNIYWQVYQKDLDNLENFFQTFEQEILSCIVTEIYRADCIYLFGVGSSTIIADFLLFHLRRMGFRVVPVSEGGGENTEKILNITSKDLLITACFPRYSKTAYHILSFAKNKGARRVTITDSPSSILAINSDVTASLKVDNITFFNSYLVPIEFCNLLLMSILEHNSRQIHDNLQRNMQHLEQFDNKL